MRIIERGISKEEVDRIKAEKRAKKQAEIEAIMKPYKSVTSCYECNTKFEFYPTDRREKEGKFYDEDMEDFHYFVGNVVECPNCEQEILVSPLTSKERNVLSTYNIKIPSSKSEREF